jgi:hypothetical protein
LKFARVNFESGQRGYTVLEMEMRRRGEKGNPTEYSAFTINFTERHHTIITPSSSVIGQCLRGKQ